jgi:hypothetical protein
MKQFWLVAAALVLTTLLPDGAFAQRGGFRGAAIGGGGIGGGLAGPRRQHRLDRLDGLVQLLVRKWKGPGISFYPPLRHDRPIASPGEVTGG